MNGPIPVPPSNHGMTLGPPLRITPDSQAITPRQGGMIPLSKPEMRTGALSIAPPAWIQASHLTSAATYPPALRRIESIRVDPWSMNEIKAPTLGCRNIPARGLKRHPMIDHHTA